MILRFSGAMKLERIERIEVIERIANNDYLENRPFSFKS